MTRDKIIKNIRELQIAFIYLQFSDLLGQLKTVAVDINRLEDILENGCWFDGSSIEGFARIAESDMLLVPDTNTFALIPWSEPECRAARLLCDVYLPSGRHLPADPRTILKLVLHRTKKMGYDFFCGAEFEFYLFERDKLPHLVPHDDKSYFDYVPHSRAIDISEHTMNALSSFGITGEMYHHEVGAGHHEIDIRFANALQSADNILTLKMVLKAFSGLGSELKATWMPKPIYGMPGSGLHMHQSLWKNQQNIFYDAKGPFNLSQTAIHFLAGQLHHARAISAVVSPTVNSYKRLVSGYEAPVYICWGGINRSALIRVPGASPKKTAKSTRIEYRAPDPTANPYLAMAALLAAGLDGIEKKMTPSAPVDDNVYGFSPHKLERKKIALLPTNLGEALDELEKDAVIGGIFNSALPRYLEIKREEYAQSAKQITAWELEKYF